MLSLMILYVAMGLLQAGLAVPLIQRRIKPNPWYGFRVPKTLHNERIWYAANFRAGVLFFLAGMGFAASAILLAPIAWLLGLGRDGYVLLCTLIMVGSLLWATVESFRYLSKL
ncbi:MAG TPA: SdpI family protein [Chthonomonadaceae bacterium]|nr:SdpI family protein [Chthonomonadaceae bacterium]